MSAKMVLARGLMRLADVLTPKDKEQWCAAIRAELSVLDETDSALGWAFGAFGMAVRWRVAAGLPLLMLVLVTIAMRQWLSDEVATALMLTIPKGGWIEPYVTFEFGTLFLLSLGLAALRPKLALYLALCVAFVGPGGLITWPLNSASSNPLSHIQGGLLYFIRIVSGKPDIPALNNPHVHNWQFIAILVWNRLGPCLYGAALGWGATWTGRRLRKIYKERRATLP